MQTANEWLLENGFISKIGRGRRSVENTARLDRAVSEGIKFSDYPKVTEVVKERLPSGKVVERTRQVSPEGDRYAPTPDPYWEDQVNFVSTSGAVGNRSVCVNCHASLQWCACSVPVVVDNAAAFVVVTRISSVTGQEVFKKFSRPIDSHPAMV